MRKHSLPFLFAKHCLLVLCCFAFVQNSAYANCTVGGVYQGPLCSFNSATTTVVYGSTGVYWDFIAAESGVALFTTCGVSFDDTYLCFQDSLGNTLFENDDDCGAQSTLLVPVTAGERYRIHLSGSSNAAGTGTIIYQLPEPTVSFSGLNCAYYEYGDTATLVGSPAGGVFSGAGVSGDMFIGADAGPGMHDVTYTYTVSCYAPITYTDSSGVYPDLVSSDTTDFCEGDTTILSTISDPSFSYQWYKDGTAISGATTYQYIITDSGSYHVRLYNGDCYAYSNEHLVNVYSIPNIYFTGLDCSYFIGKDPEVITGFPSGGVFSGTGMFADSFNPSLAGLGGHVVTYAYTPFGCPTQTVSSDTVRIYTDPIPLGPTTFCEGDSVELTVASYAGYGYQWYRNGTAITGQTGTSTQARLNGSYQVQLTDLEGCSFLSVPIPVVVNVWPSSWTEREGGTGSDVAYDVKMDAAGNTSVIGFFSGVTNFTGRDTSQLVQTQCGSNTINMPSSGSTTYTICDATFRDHGGTGYYSNSRSNTRTTFYPCTANQKITITFTSFSLECCCDYVRIYDGPSTSYPLLGQYNCTSLPPSFTSSHSTGALTIRFDSDGSVTRQGFEAQISCGPAIGTTITSAGSNDAFIARYDDEGDLLWVDNIGGSDTEYGRAVDVDDQGNTYLAGEFQGATYAGNVYLSTSSSYDQTLLVKYDQNGSVVWAKQGGDYSSTDEAHGVAVSTNGSVYLTGRFNGTADFGTLPDLSPAGSYDAFLVRYDANGNELWARSYGGVSAEYGEEVATDADGNAYIAGRFYDYVDMNNGFSLSDPGGNYGGYLAKVDSFGNTQWVRGLVGSSTDYIMDVDADAAGNVYIAAYSASTDAVFGGVPLGSDDGSYDSYVAKLDAFGNLQWIKQLGGPDSDFARGISVSDNGDVYVTGYCRDSIMVDGNLFVAGASYDGFVFGFSSAGVYQSGQLISGGNNNYSFGIDARGLNDVMVAGYFTGTAYVAGDSVVSAGSNDIFLMNLGEGVSPATSGSTYFCDGDQVLLYANSSTNFAFQWQLDGSNIPGANANTYLSDTSGDYSVFSTYLPTGCTNTIPIATVTVNPYPDAEITISGDTVLCEGEEVVLTATNDANLEQQWYVNNTILSGETSASLFVDDPGDYRVVVTNDTSDCATPSREVEVVVNPLPLIMSWQNAVTGGGSSFDKGEGVDTDPSGNIYVTGYYLGTANFSGTTLSNNGIFDLYVAKYNSSGNLLWIQNAGGTSFDYAHDITVDGSGTYAYVTGRFAGTASFGSYSVTSVGGDDVFIAKIRLSDGAWQWVQRGGGSSADEGFSIISESTSFIYVTGKYTGTATFGSYSLTAAGGSDIFVASINSSGTWQWATSGGGTLTDVGNGIAIDDNADLYVTGAFSDVSTFDSHSLISAGGRDIFTAKLDSDDGSWTWVSGGGSTLDDEGQGVSVDTAGNVYFTGYFNDNATFGGGTVVSSVGQTDIITGKYDPNGTILWTRRSGGANFDRGYAINSDDNGNTFVTGYFYDTADFSFTTLVSEGASDVFVMKYDTDGVLQAAVSAGGTGPDQGYGMATDAGDNAYVTGWYQNTASFDNDDITSQGFDDMFMAKLTTAPTVSIVPQGATTFCNGDSVILSTNISSGYTIQWQLDGMDIPGATGVEYTAKEAGSYTVAITNVFDCSIYSNAVIVVTTPVVSLVTSSSTTLCPGASVTISAPSGAGYTYQWYDDSGPISGEVFNFYTANVAGNYSVIVQEAGCTDTSEVMVVTEAAAPSATITPLGDLIACDVADSLLLLAAGGNDYTYQWKQDGFDIAGATDQMYAPGQSGAYSVTISNLCGTSTSSFIAVETNYGRDVFEPNDSLVVAADLPDIGVNHNAFLCYNGDYDWYKMEVTGSANNVRVSLLDLPEDYNLEWYNDSGVLLLSSTNTGLTDEVLTANNIPSGTYYLRVYGDVSVSGDAVGYILRPIFRNTPFNPGGPKEFIDGKDLTGESTFNLYPNPTTGDFFVDVYAADAGSVAISLHDLNGKLMMNQTETVVEGTNVLEVVTDEIPAGIYFVRIQQGERTFIEKLQIVK